MRKLLAILLLTMIILTNAFSAGFLSATLSPFIETGSSAWFWGGGGIDARDAKHFSIGGEVNIDYSFFEEFGNHMVGGNIGLGVQMPIYTNNEATKPFNLYTLALNPTLAFAYGYNFNESFALEIDLGFGYKWGFLNGEKDGTSIKGDIMHILEYFLSTEVYWNFKENLALNAGLSLTFPCIIIPEIYNAAITTPDGITISRSSMISTIFHIEPFIGISYTY